MPRIDKLPSAETLETYASILEAPYREEMTGLVKESISEVIAAAALALRIAAAVSRTDINIALQLRQSMERNAVLANEVARLSAEMADAKCLVATYANGEQEQKSRALASEAEVSRLSAETAEARQANIDWAKGNVVRTCETLRMELRALAAEARLKDAESFLRPLAIAACDDAALAFLSQEVTADVAR